MPARYELLHLRAKRVKLTGEKSKKRYPVRRRLRRSRSDRGQAEVFAMSEIYGDDFITITGDDGVSYELEHLDTIEYEGRLYMAFLPVSENEDEVYEMILFRVVEEDGEELLETIDDDNEAELVYAKFMEQLFAEDNDED